MLEFSLSTFIFQMVNFLVLLAILAWFFYKPVLRVMREREESANARTKAVEDRSAALDAEKKRLEADRQATEEQVDKLLADARAEAADIRREAMDDARRRSESVLDEAKRRSDERVRAGEERLRTEAQESALRIATAIINRVAGLTIHEALVGQFIASLPDAPAEPARAAVTHAGVRVAVETAHPLSEGATAKVRAALAAWLEIDDAKLEFDVQENPALEAGIRVTIGTATLDMSLSSLIEDLKETEQPEPAA